jgi:hypothetical protein
MVAKDQIDIVGEPQLPRVVPPPKMYGFVWNGLPNFIGKDENNRKTYDHVVKACDQKNFRENDTGKDRGQ